jgi:hypothetical protein
VAQLSTLGIITRFMKPRDIFKIIVATIGVLGFSYGALYLMDGLLCQLGLFDLQHSRPGYYAARGVIEMMVGILFIKGMPPFVDLAFPPDESPKDEHDDTKPDA